MSKMLDKKLVIDRMEEIADSFNGHAKWIVTGIMDELRKDIESGRFDVNEDSEVSRLQVERDKAIEGLQWYAQADYGQYCDFLDPRNEAHADKATYILSELGVPHETT